jgi:dienelactone hydrolase
MSIYLNWIKKLEAKGFEKHEKIKIVKEFSWGLEALGITEQIKDPLKFYKDYNKRNIAESSSYFIPPKLTLKDFQSDNTSLRFQSSINTSFKENDTALFNYYPIEDAKGVIIVIPHWNAEGDRYDKIARYLNKLNYSTLRMVLPFHVGRDDKTPESSTRMVSANIGLTLLAMQQGVRDLISSIDWLYETGQKNIGILSSSIGSCVGFLAAAHDNRIKAFFANHMSSYFGDVVWDGYSTKHISQSVSQKISQDDLRLCWSLNSPQCFIPQLMKYNKELKLFIMAGEHDTTFPPKLTEKIIKALNKAGLDYQKMILPCGHYSLGNYWFKYIDAFQIGRFFLKNLNN